MPAKQQTRPRPAPQDHKRPAAETAEQPYEFTSVTGETYELPPASAITGGMIRRTRHMTEVDQAFAILEELLDVETLEALDGLPLEQWNAVLDGWTSQIGVTPGK